MTIEQLKERKKAIINQMKEMLRSAQSANRGFSTDEDRTYDKLDNELDDIILQIKTYDEETDANRINGPIIGLRQFVGNSDPNKRHNQGYFSSKQNARSDNYVYNPKGETFRDKFNRYLVYGERALSTSDIIDFENRSYEARAGLQTDLDSKGGFITPEQMANNVIMDLNQSVTVRTLCRKMTVPNASAFAYPKVETNMGDLEWTAELSTGSEDDDLDLGQVKFYPHPLARRIKVSKKLLRTAGINPENIVREQFVYKLGTVQNNAFLNGNGVNQPLGVFTASDNGITASRDCNTFATQTMVTYDQLTETVKMLPMVYRKGAVWLVSEAFQSKSARLKDGEGQPLWQSSMRDGFPDQMLGFPVVVDSFVPDTFTSGQYVAILGNFQHYLVVDALTMEIQVLTELYAENNQNGYICRAECDGNALIETAFVRVQLAS